MSSAEQTTEKKATPPTNAGPVDAPAAAKMSDDAATKETLPAAAAEADAAQATPKETSESTEKPAEATAEKPTDKPGERVDENKDAEMKEATDAPAAPDAVETKTDAADVPAPAAQAATPVADKSKDKSRRKSGSVPEHKGKKLNKKGSKARITNLNAQPGDQYLVKLKGYPPWPAIICDEDMLPQNLLTTRPVTARRTDGTYREDFADGGKRAHDRVFPVMYLYTNEFGWVGNTCLQELSPERAGESINDRMRKDLQAAYELASQGNDLGYYKEMLRTFQEEAIAREEAKQAKAAKAVADTRAKSSQDEDIEMPDAAETETPAKKSKKRKAEGEAATPQRSDSVKKPKIKITSSATKSANGVSTPKSAKEQSAPKAAKPKAKKPAEEKKAEPAAPKEPEMTPEERHQRKEKEVLFLRHKLQKGLLTRDQEPKEEEMKLMSDYITKLEGFPELEVSIIRATKINKVLKAILKLEAIPKEDEFNFKTRSQTLLDKWNKLLADAPAAAPTTTAAPANGVNGVAGKKEKAGKPGPNGVTEENAAKSDKTTSEAPPEKSEGKTSETAAEGKADNASEEAKESKEVEATA